MDEDALAATIGKRIRELRDDIGLTQEKLAYECAAISSKGYLSDIEAGKRLPSLPALIGLAARLGVDVLDLVADPSTPRGSIVELTRRMNDEQLAMLIASAREIS